MKRTLAFALSLLLALASLCGCAPEAKKEEAAKAAPFTADNEIFTYEKPDAAKTQITVSVTGNIRISALCEAFEAKHPDVQVIALDITGGDGDERPSEDWARAGLLPDAMFLAPGMFAGDLAKEYLENLSARPCVASFQAEALNRVAVDGNLYSLPGPSNVDCLMYNKTMFEEHGWAVPETFDEFVALCVRIREETDGAVEAWNPNAKYSSEILCAMEGFCYGSLFAGVDNRAWYKALMAGEAKYAGHIEPMYEAARKLIDNGIVREEHFTYSATTRGNEFREGKIAMINVPLTFDTTGMSFEAGYMPFPGLNEDEGYLSDSFYCCLALPKKERDAKTRDAVDRFVDYFCSVEGQQAYIGDSLMVSNVKGVPLQDSGRMALLQQAIDAGRMFTRLEFYRAGYPSFSIGGDMRAMLLGERTEAECLAAIDAPPQEVSASPAALAPVAAAKEDFTILEVSQYIADMYREAADAQIGLIVHNETYRGNVMRLFAGDISARLVTVLKPRSLGNDSTLVRAEMSGRQLLDALDHPVGVGEGPSEAVYACSGLRCSVAPWNPAGEKTLSVTLADGSQIDPAKTYTVAFWAGTVAQEYISGALEPIAGTFEELLTAKLSAEGEVRPAKDGRMTLVWEPSVK